MRIGYAHARLFVNKEPRLLRQVVVKVSNHDFHNHFIQVYVRPWKTMQQFCIVGSGCVWLYMMGEVCEGCGINCFGSVVNFLDNEKSPTSRVHLTTH